ncbi:MAG: DUF1236 domain-containing protein [Methylocella sp.]|jgi:hypothetical protein
MRTFFLSSIAGVALVTGGGLAAAPMEKDMDRGYVIAMGARGPESRPTLQERRSVATVDLSSDQKTRLHAILVGGNLHSIDHANFALSVETRIPRIQTIYDVPQSIVDIVPQYRGFDYIVSNKNLLIVDPSTRGIVYVFSD